jgi:Terminase RNaseH-like domain
MPSVTIDLPALHASQRKALDECRRFNALCAGRRWGKNVWGITRLAEFALKGYPVALFSPTYRVLGDSFRELVGVLAPVTLRKSEVEKRIELKGGGSVEAWSLDDENAGRSRRYKHVVIDEAAHISNLEAAFNGSIRPTLTDLQGSADLISTPKGRGFFYRCWCRGQDPEQPEWMSWTFPSSTNPILSPDEIEAARAQLPERVFSQEYLAKFMDDAGGVFRKVAEAIDRGRTPQVQEADNYAGEQHWEFRRRYGDYPSIGYSMGLDLGRHHDFTVVCILDSNCKQVYFDRWSGVSWSRQISGIVHVAERFKPYIYVDATGVGDAIFEQLRNKGLYVQPFVFTNTSKTQLMDNLASVIENGGVRLMDIPVQEGELINYEYLLTPSRNVIMSAPEGEFDDCVCSLALAAWGVKRGCYSAGAY